MTKRELIRIVHDKTNMRFDDIKIIFESIFEEIENGLIDEGKVIISGFGSFEKYTQAEHEGINPSTGEKISIKEISKIRYTPSVNLRESINKK